MVDFIIVSAPVAISLDCPFCEEEIEIRWKDAHPPKDWTAPWDDVECPNCKSMIALGDWTYD